MSAEAHCKGCGGPMTEGRAYELGNHRWHVGCFRCSICENQLTAHTNMLVLGDGTLVCANCSYTCAVCSKKIMDMAVLTNDQAFCASCFVCRNCKKRIDDLQYARTSQGIFCMNCHNALLARKRQRQLQRQQQQKSQVSSPQSQTPQMKPTTENVGASNGNPNSNPGSSKSSLVSTSSYNRNKGLPDLPNSSSAADTPVLGGTPAMDLNLDFDALAAKALSERPKNVRQASGGKESRQLRVPRKQLAPSAFQNVENDAAGGSASSGSQSASPKPEPLKPESMQRSHSISSTPQQSNMGTPQSPREDTPSAELPPVWNDSQLPHQQLVNGADGDSSETRSYKLADPLPEPVSIGTPPRSPFLGDENSSNRPLQSSSDSANAAAPSAATAAAALNAAAAAATSSADRQGLNVPNRSQLRPVSPTKSWRSPSTNTAYSPRSGSATSNTIGLNSPINNNASLQALSSPRATSSVMGADGSPKPSRAISAVSASPTQAVAPNNSNQMRSPFTARWQHQRNSSSGSSVIKRDDSLAHSRSQSLKSIHKRSASDNQATAFSTSRNGSKSSVDRSGSNSAADDQKLQAATAALAVERERSRELERQLNMYKRRDTIQSEVDTLAQQLASMWDEHKLLNTRNHQLTEMNAELQRQTLEKFGPNSLWGSLNPAPLSPYDQSMTSQSSQSSSSMTGAAAAAAAGNNKDLPKESPLVTRLDQPAGNQGSSGGKDAMQAQFLPFKTAKQWLFRRPNKPGDRGGSSIPASSSGQFSQPYGQPVLNGVTTNGSSDVRGGKIAYLSGPEPSGTSTANSTNSHPTNNNNNNNHNNNHNNSNNNGNTASNSNGMGQHNSLLGDSLRYRCQIDHAPVPYFVTRCFAEVERRGLNTEGVYRKPGSKSQVDAILEQFGPDGDPALGEELLGGDIQAVTSAVKQYLRRLIDPVITYDCYDSFIAAGNSRNINVLKKSIQALPAEHIATLKAVASHLALVASHEQSNLMNIKNLAMVFAPTLARDEVGDREIPDMQARNEATHMLIVHADTLLDPYDELL